MSALAPCVAPPLGRGLGGGLGTHANQASIPESQDQQASVANGNRRPFGGSPEPTPPCRAPLRWRGTLREFLEVAAPIESGRRYQAETPCNTSPERATHASPGHRPGNRTKPTRHQP